MTFSHKQKTGKRASFDKSELVKKERDQYSRCANL